MAESMNWYAIRTQNNRERSVLEKLKLEISRENLNDILGRNIIPTEKVYSVKNGKRVAKERILYPGYLFIETSHVGEINNFLKMIKGSSGFVKSKNGDINPLHDWEVKKMLQEQESNDNKEVDTNIFTVGEEVKVTDGPFSSFRGNVSFIDSEKSKLKVEVSIFSRVTTLELDFIQVERTV